MLIERFQRIHTKFIDLILETGITIFVYDNKILILMYVVIEVYGSYKIVLDFENII